MLKEKLREIQESVAEVLVSPPVEKSRIKSEFVDKLATNIGDLADAFIDLVDEVEKHHAEAQAPKETKKTAKKTSKTVKKTPKPPTSKENAKD